MAKHGGIVLVTAAVATAALSPWLILFGQTQNIGFMIAAKSVLRFGVVADDRKVSEYVIIGTLASVTWAIVAALMPTILLNHLPPLGIPDLLP